MKKLFLLIVICLASFSFSGEVKYKFEFTMPELQTILYLIDQSNAPHSTVKQVQDLINRQYSNQLIDSTKPK